MTVMHGLPTSVVFDIVNAVGPMLHVNFMDRLPPEVCLKVLGFLDPVSLVQMAQASRGFMSLSTDWTLWQQLYYQEGWRTNRIELRKFEEELAKETLEISPSYQPKPSKTLKRKAEPRTTLSITQENRIRDQDDDLEMPDADRRSPLQQNSIFGGPASRTSADKIKDEVNSPGSQRSFGTSRENRASPAQSSPGQESPWTAKVADPSDIASMSSLVILDRRENKRKLNWQYLYTQRRRLETNWESGKYVNFQLPHPDHPGEAHKECIYTIQYSGKYLVSGSRDRTLRVWNLDTRRLILPPLEGHGGSVLCLQFDPDPTEDIIVSGSSDATVRIWQFSTGKPLQVLRKAHRESVLNVRFDHRILVTCSKDKTIKIFNRRPLHPGELGYPGMPQIVKSVPTVLNNYGYNPSPYEKVSVKPPYTMIGCLEGHGAAVNAIQIHGNEIVSASGDRNIKVWNWPEQTCTRTLLAHQKGIACVQYDGRRIVSGSSDNEVKIFDQATGLEVASLRAHTNLVRTVQAGFGDLPGSAEDDQAAARNIDNDYFRAVDSGIISRTVPKTRGARNAGSRRPEHIMAYGAKLPPGGGGGSRYGRIVSGSYDETITIWRRDKEGIWKAQHTLRQADAARAALVEFSNRPSLSPPHSLPNQTPGTPAYFHALIDLVVPMGPAALRQAIYQNPQIIQFTRLQSAILAEPDETARQQMRAIVQHAILRHQTLLMQYQMAHPNAPPGAAISHSSAMLAMSGMQGSAQHGAAMPFAQMQGIPQALAHTQGQSQSQSQSGPSLHHATVQDQPEEEDDDTPVILVPGPAATASSNPAQAAAAAQTAQAAATAQAHQQAQAAATQAHQAALANAMGGAQAHGNANGNNTNMARVFKLQFDARRIICCSQMPVIVGWDFANGDERIEEASGFFGVVE